MGSRQFKLYIALLASLGLFSCLFDDQSNASGWVLDQGYPDKYSVQEIQLTGLKPLAQVWLDTLPFQATSVGAIGQGFGSRQELFLQILLGDTLMNRWMRTQDSNRVAVRLYLDSSFYAQMNIGDSLPLEDSISLKLWWTWQSELSINALDSLQDMADTTWYRNLLEQWIRTSNQDSTEISMVFAPQAAKDTLEILLPKALVDSLTAQHSYARMQLRIRLDQANRIYRFAGPASAVLPPALAVTGYSEQDSNYAVIKDSMVMNMAQVGFSTETCTNCLVLHAGMRESLTVELPADTLRSLLGSLPMLPGSADSIDATRFVLMAQLVLPGTTDQSGSEMGLPVPVLAFANMDSMSELGTKARNVAESSVLDSLSVKRAGHLNLLYYLRDSVTTQITSTMRAYVQGMNYGASPKVTIRLGRPMWSPKEVHNSDYQTTDSTWIRIYSEFPSYSRWDLGSPDSLKVNLRIWWADRTGGSNP